MRILLTSHGSTGDIFPLIGLGRALREAGHHVRYATAPLYREEIERAGLEFVELPPYWERELFAEFMRELSRKRFPLLQLIHIYCGALPFMGEVVGRLDAAVRDADVMVGSYFFPHLRHVAARHQVPFAAFAFCHNLVPTPRVPPEGFPRLRFLPAFIQKRWNRLCWRLASTAVDVALNTVCGTFFRQQNLPASKGFLTEPADLELVAVSPALMGRRWRAESRFAFTGYLRWQEKEDPGLERELQAFTAGGRVPVLTFGSVTFDETHSVMHRFLSRWPKDRKIIIQSGWAGLSVELLTPNIKVVGRVSHDQLFRHASCVIHHGGAGTTASVLHAGVPQVIIPHIADQAFWGAEIRRLKVGVVIPRKTWPEQLPSRVRSVEQSARIRAAAKAASEALAEERGPVEAVRLLERYAALAKRGIAEAEGSMVGGTVSGDSRTV